MILIKNFSSPNEYIHCLEYIKEVLASNNFKLIESTCAIDQIYTTSGHWAADYIEHVIQCNGCKQTFICYANTYRGGGGFIKQY